MAVLQRFYLYKIKNNINNKIYIGVRSSERDFLSIGYYGGGVAIRNAVKFYGRKNFTRTVIKEFSTKQEAYDAEAFLVNKDFVKRKDVYNIRTGGILGSTKTASSEVAVKSLDKNGNIEHYSSYRSADRKSGVYASNIRDCVIGNRKFAGGKLWTLESQSFPDVFPKNERERRFVICYDKQMNLIREFENPTLAAKKLKLNYPHVLSVLKKKRKSTGGYKFEYKESINA